MHTESPTRLARRRFLRTAAALPAVLGLAACATPSTSSAASAKTNDLTDASAKPASAAATKRAPKPAATVGATAMPAKPVNANLPNSPVAPAIVSDAWINTKPIAWDSLRGTVVMVEFWTFGCINCQNVIPLMKSVYADYKDRGFTLLSVHSPEFDYEKQLPNVKDAVKKWGITYPVAQDNDFANWRRYRNGYWPARYVVDKRGIVRFNYIGEGGEAETRQWIETLLAE